jgi:hypothetical protein
MTTAVVNDQRADSTAIAGDSFSYQPDDSQEAVFGLSDRGLEMLDTLNSLFDDLESH